MGEHSCFSLVSPRLQLACSGKGLACSPCSSICPLSLLPTHLVKYPEWEPLKSCCQRARGGDLSQRERSSLWRIGQEREECGSCREVLKAWCLHPRRQLLPSPRIIGNSPSCGLQLWGYRYPFPLPVLLFSMITQERPKCTTPWSPPNP